MNGDRHVEVARDVRPGRVELLGPSRREVQGAPLGGERPGRREADAAGASGYQDGTALQPEVHGPPV